MLDTKQFLSAIHQIAEEKGISKDKIVETIQLAIAAAYKKDYGEKSQIIRAKLDPETGDIGITQIKYVIEGADEEGYVTGPLPLKLEEEKDVSERRLEQEAGEELKIKYSPEKHILLEEAKKINKKLKVGDEVVTVLETKTDFGRIAAQTAKQVIIQKLREIERDVIFEEFKKKEGEIISGVVQRREGPMVFVDLGKTNGLLIPAEQIENDNYRINQRFRFYILRVEETNKGPVILLSRSHPRLIAKLFEFEVPEIETGSVEIKSIAREAGSRSKIAVLSKEEGIDPIGSLVGQKGVRVQTVINELSGEKIDIIEWNDDSAKFIANALSPAKVLDVKIMDKNRQHALVEVGDDQFSLAIGKKGQNVRLAAKLTGWKIDVRSPKEKISSEELESPSADSEPAIGGEPAVNGADAEIETK
ncbi:MAG: transcription termination/antitermination protein NusA [Candidatus Yanofskybacteria bacterium]|nr:transcription termination/antitermination protein NusA [Candidatus Yanofskybacteria bacterium]